jgi:NADH-quinone oxidoreductase subunit H
LTKELIRPSAASNGLFRLGPIMAIMPALAAWVAVPFGPEAVLANLNAGLLVILAITSIEVYGVIIAGWASNSKYAFLGALRASAQMVSYEIAIGFCFLVVVMTAGSLNLGEIVASQERGTFADMGLNFLSWNWLPLLPIFMVYLISGVAETNRHPFDVVEGEAEIVAGHMVEYSGMGFAIFFLAEYASMWLVSILAVLMFLGGWDAPVAGLEFVPGWIWLGLKTFVVVSMFIWIRATFPRFRYDQIMRLGWKIFIPVTLIWLISILAVLMFLGGWDAPVAGLEFVPGWIWLGLKTFVVVSMFIWIRATFPRFRYDQIMRLGWKIFIPVTLIWLVLVGAFMQTPWNIWK